MTAAVAKRRVISQIEAMAFPTLPYFATRMWWMCRLSALNMRATRASIDSCGSRKRCCMTMRVSITGRARASIGPPTISAVGDFVGRTIEQAASSRPMNMLPVSPMKIFAGGLFQR